MGYSHSTYHFYGVHVPKDQYETDHIGRETEWLDAVIGSVATPYDASLGHITAGNYDRDELFLVAGPRFDPNDESTHIEVRLGSWRRVDQARFQKDVAIWDDLLSKVVSAAGYTGLDKPGWIVVPDLS